MAEDATLTSLEARIVALETPTVSEVTAVKSAISSWPGWAKLGGYSRMGLWGFAAIALGYAVYSFAEAQVGVGLWKCAIAFSGAYAGYWLDRTLFPYARPHTLTADENDAMWSKNDPQGHVFVGSMIRRAVIVASTMLAFAVAL